MKKITELDQVDALLRTPTEEPLEDTLSSDEKNMFDTLNSKIDNMKEVKKTMKKQKTKQLNHT